MIPLFPSNLDLLTITVSITTIFGSFPIWSSCKKLYYWFIKRRIEFGFIDWPPSGDIFYYILVKDKYNDIDEPVKIVLETTAGLPEDYKVEIREFDRPWKSIKTIQKNNNPYKEIECNFQPNKYYRVYITPCSSNHPPKFSLEYDDSKVRIKEKSFKLPPIKL